MAPAASTGRVLHLIAAIACLAHRAGAASGAPCFGSCPGSSTILTSEQQMMQCEPLAPALFLLGDSVLDAGNNNGFLTLAKVNHYPYGVDFPGNVPTGRFTNGYTIADYAAFKVGLPLIPAYHNPATKGKRLLKGVNFASGGSGILPETGLVYGEVVSFQDQVKNLQDVKEKLGDMLGASAAELLLANAAFLVVTGSNDWLLSYFNPILPIHVSDNLSAAEKHRDNLINLLVAQLEAMHAVGARKIVVAGLPALGCCPSQVLEYGGNGTCVDHINAVASDYNEKLQPRILALNDKLVNASVAYVDIYAPFLRIAQNPSELGFKTGNTACCGIGKFKGFLTCLPGLQPCENPNEHFYWDAYHPTQNFYPYMIDLIWNNGPPYSFPVSVQEIFTSTVPSQSQPSESHTEL